MRVAAGTVLITVQLLLAPQMYRRRRRARPLVRHALMRRRSSLSLSLVQPTALCRTDSKMASFPAGEGYVRKGKSAGSSDGLTPRDYY